MKIRSGLFFLVLAVLGVTVLIAPRSAFAQNKDAAAKALSKKAMDEDYLGTDFAGAQAKLEKAIAACGTDKCSAPVRAELRRNLGVVFVGGLNDSAKGTAQFVEALKADPGIQLDPDLKTKEIEAAWAAAKKQAGGGGGGGAGGGGTPDNSGQPSGDFTHTPAAEQTYRTPVPVYAEYKGEEKLVRVVAKYKGFGMSEFKSVELKKMGESGFGGLIPCADVQVGNMQYYLQGFNDQNDPVAVGGNPKNTYKVAVKREKIEGEAPHLPGEAPPSACADTGDCPPDFPGCHKPKTDGPSGKDSGETCEEDGDCKSKLCEKKKNESEGVCAENVAKKAPKFFVGVNVTFDIGFVGSQDDVCKLHPKDATDPDKTSATPLNTSGYYCVRDDGSDYPLRAGDGSENGKIQLNTPARQTDHVGGGSAPGNLRLLASFDYAVTPNILAGARAGVAVLGYPGSAAAQDGKRFGAAPLHLEARGTYVIGKDGVGSLGIQPYLFLGGGVSTFETQVSVSVVETGNPTARKVTAWQVTGPGFVTVGGGVRYALPSHVVLVGGLRANFAFGSAFVPTVGPDIGVQYGF